MGRDYSATLAIGFSLTADELERPFRKTVDEESHVEPRYNEVTGERYEKKIVDQTAGTRVIVGDEDLTGDPLQLIDRVLTMLEERCGFTLRYDSGGDWYEGEFEFVIGLCYPWDEESFNEPCLDPQYVVTAEQSGRVEVLRRHLIELGYFDPGPYRIRALMLVS